MRQYAVKPIITAYPPPFVFDQDMRPKQTLVRQDGAFVMRVKKDPAQILQPDCATLLFDTEYIKANFVQGFHVAGGFLFSSGDLVYEVPCDPYLYFHGEEQSIAVRAFTRAWTIFHPHHDLIPICHLYKQPNHQLASVHWNAEHEKHRRIKWVKLKERSDRTLCDLLYQRRKNMAYGLGDQRSLVEFITMSGLDYPNLSIREPAEPQKIFLEADNK